MFIRFQTDNKGRPSTVILGESYRIKGSKYPKQRTIKTIGRVSDIRDKYNGMSDKEISKILLKEYENDSNVLNMSIDLSKTNTLSNKLFNYGYIVIEHILNSFNLDKILSPSEYNILSSLISLRIINPSSKLKSYNDIPILLGKNNTFRRNNIYDILDTLYNKKEDIITSINNTFTTRDLSYCFYDTTNFYFETDYTTSTDIRQKGLSKENRPLPLVGLGILIDNNNIPIHYKMFNGNINDHQTLKPIIDEYISIYKLNKVIVVADAGINSLDNLVYLANNGGYIVRQHINIKTPKIIKDYVLDASGYVYEDGSLNKSKTILINRKVGNQILKEKVVITYKKEYYDRDYIKHTETLERIKDKLKDHDYISSVKKSGIDKYFKLDSKDNKYIFNEKSFNDLLKYSGYYAIITSETYLSQDEIIYKYRNLINIEKCFKIIKSYLEGRPMFVNKESHIEGHLMICYIALTILQILSNKLNNNYDISQIKESIIKATCFELSSNNIYKLNGQDELLVKILKELKIYDTLNKEYIRLEQFLKI
jgi:transposase